MLTQTTRAHGRASHGRASVRTGGRTALPERRSALQEYLAWIATRPMRSQDEQFALARRARSGDMDARQQLVESNLRFVVSIAKEYPHQSHDELLELISEGNEALCRAATSYDPEQGWTFRTYAVQGLRRALYLHVARRGRMLSAPPVRVAEAVRVGARLAKAQAESGALPSTEVLAAEMGLSRDVLDGVLHLASPAISLDAPLRADGSGDDDRIADTMIGDDPEQREAQAAALERAQLVDTALRHLPVRLRRIVTRFYGLDGREADTLTDLAASMGMSRQRVSQLLEEAHTRLRRGQAGAILSLVAETSAA